MPIGRSDQRPIILVPEVSKGVCTGLVLLHARFRAQLDAPTLRQILNGYRNRYSRLRDQMEETNSAFRDEDLERVSILSLLAEPVPMLADQLAGAAKT